jgi:hypothetical protein
VYEENHTNRSNIYASQIQNFGDWELMSMVGTGSPVVHNLRDTPKCRAETIEIDTRSLGCKPQNEPDPVY